MNRPVISLPLIKTNSEGEFMMKATLITDPITGKKKLTDFHFPYETIRILIDMSFIKSANPVK